MTTDYRTLSELTQKGAALHTLAANYAQSQAEALAVGADVSADVLVVNGVSYEILSVQTDTAINTSGNEWNNVLAGPQIVTLAAHGYTVTGQILRVQSEYFVVDSIVNANTLTVSRAQFGSVAATHADAVDIFETATAPAAGTKTLPVEDIGTVATLAADIKRGFDFYDDNTVETTIVGTSVFFIASEEKFDLVVDDAGLTASVFTSYAKVAKGVAQGAVIVHAVTAGEATAGVIRKVLGFDPVSVSYHLTPVAGTLVASDTVISSVDRVVTLTEGAAPVWAAGDVFVIFAS